MPERFVTNEYDEVVLSFELMSCELTDFSLFTTIVCAKWNSTSTQWIAASTAMYIMTSLVNNEDPERALNSRDGRRISDTDAKKDLRNSVADALSKFDFWFVPVVNPDGYEYARTNDRLWRKTRSRSGLCTGVDPNRNYAYHWRESGASSISCSEVYAGPHALSEPETKVIARILKKNGNRIAMYLTLHSYSQLFLAPYGYAQIYPDNYAEMSRVASEGMQAIASLHGTHYRFGPSAIVLYAAAGGSDDYAHGVANIKLSYTIELPDEGRYGFLLPADRIIPVGREILAGVTAMTRAI